VTVVDPLLDDVSGSFANTLAVGVSECHNFSYTVQSGDPDPLNNTVTVHSDPVGPFTNDVTDFASATIDIFNACIEVTKTADVTTALVGDTITFTICVKNCGDFDLENIVVVDSLKPDLSGDFNNTLAAGKSQCYDYPYIVKSGDPDPLNNTVTVHSNPVGFPDDITDSASDDVDIVHPCIAVNKTTDRPYAMEGDVVTYMICVQNCGDIALEHITVGDSLLGDLSGSFADTLAVGASECHTFPYTVKVGDPDPLINNVTVHSDPVGAFTKDITDFARLDLDIIDPCIQVTKTADKTIASEGDVITYTICVQNCGDVALEHIAVADTYLYDLSSSFADTLAVGAPPECHTFSYIVGFGDPDPLVNTVIVHADPAGYSTNDITDNSSATVPL
jgi:uncharacterized repeat protein (TIGR01451 family)